MSSSLSPVELLYVVVRTGGAAALAARAWRTAGVHATLLAQLAADVCATLFLFGFTDAAVRSAVGAWWVWLFLYAVCWEGVRLRQFYWEAVESPAADNATAAETLVAPAFWFWELFGVAPALGAGAVLFTMTVNAVR